MGQLTEKPFRESCCDGGEQGSCDSAQPCGCDPKAKWVCEQHREKAVPQHGHFSEAIAKENQQVLERARAQGFQITLPAPPPTAEFMEKTLKVLGMPQDPARKNASGAPTRATTLPEGAKERKQFPIATGVLDYFPDAIVALAEVSWEGSNQHHPGQPLHWDRNKSTDEDDTVMRHFMQRGTWDVNPVTGKRIRHTAKAAWRLLAILQKEIENDRS